MIDERETMLKTAVGGVCRTMLSFEPHSIPLDKDTIATDGLPASSVGSVVKVTGVLHIYEETKDWRFMASFQEALAAMN